MLVVIKDNLCILKTGSRPVVNICISLHVFRRTRSLLLLHQSVCNKWSWLFLRFLFLFQFVTHFVWLLLHLVFLIHHDNFATYHANEKQMSDIASPSSIMDSMIQARIFRKCLLSRFIFYLRPLRKGLISACFFVFLERFDFEFGDVDALEGLLPSA